MGPGGRDPTAMLIDPRSDTVTAAEQAEPLLTSFGGRPDRTMTHADVSFEDCLKAASAIRQIAAR